MECKACAESILETSDPVICSGSCKSHFHFSCGGYSEKAFRKLSAYKKKRWIYVACVNNKDSSTSKATSITDSQSVVNPISKVSDDSNSLVLLMEKQHKDLKEFVSRELEEFKKTIDFNNTIIQELKVSILDLQTTNKNLQQENKQLVTENVEIKKEIKDLRMEVTELKQYSRRANIEISNIPETENENISQLMSTIGDLANCNLKENIVIAHRIPSFNKDRPKPIIVQFTSKSVRDNILKTLKDRKLQSSEINNRFTDMPIFFNEHLTPELKKLFFFSRKFKTEHSFKFCWVRDGKIFLRQNDSSKIYRIQTQEDLNVRIIAN